MSDVIRASECSSDSDDQPPTGVPPVAMLNAWTDPVTPKVIVFAAPGACVPAEGSVWLDGAGLAQPATVKVIKPQRSGTGSLLGDILTRPPDW